MLSIIYPHRNRDIKRINRSLQSLQEQSVRDFAVHFVDYGSSIEFSKEIECLLKTYDFVNYTHYPTYYQPWNKCRALNSVIKNLETDFCFVADIDMIFHHDFVKTAIKLQEENTTVYFQVGFLNASETKKSKVFQEYKIDFKGTNEATGLSMFPLKALKSINGFDEFYHFWGAEDTDVHVRLKNVGYKVQFYEKEILMLHQWHQSYRSKESKKLTSELRLSNVVKFNHQHLKYAISNTTKTVNENGWGNPLSNKACMQLSNFKCVTRTVMSKKEEVDHFLWHELPNFKENIISVKFKLSAENNTIKYHLKKILGQKVPTLYSLKEVNDILLMHVINLYRDFDYNIKIDVDLNEIHFKIKRP